MNFGTGDGTSFPGMLSTGELTWAIGADSAPGTSPSLITSFDLPTSMSDINISKLTVTYSSIDSRSGEDVRLYRLNIDESTFTLGVNPILNKLVTDIDLPGLNPAYWTGDDMNNTDQLKNADPGTEEAWLEALLGKDYDDPSVNLIYRILKGTGGLGFDDKSLTDFDPGFLWAYAVVKYDGMWIAYENNGLNNLLTTDTFDWGISHITFFGPTSVPEPATMLLLGLGLMGLIGFRRKLRD